jgi:predicted small lipoprotein YifL
MNERQATSLAAGRRPASRAVFLAACVLAFAAAAGCGQKGPLYLPSTNASAAAPAARLPAAPDDRMPHGPATPPPLSASSPQSVTPTLPPASPPAR